VALDVFANGHDILHSAVTPYPHVLLAWQSLIIQSHA